MCIINAANCIHSYKEKTWFCLQVRETTERLSETKSVFICSFGTFVCVWHFQSAVLWNSIQNTDGLLLCTVVIFSQKLRKYQGWKAIFEKVFISFHICISIYIIVGNFTPVIVNVINTCLQSQQLPHLSMKYKKISNKFFCNERVIIILTGYMKG